MYVSHSSACKMCDCEAAAAAQKKLFEDYCEVNYIERDEPSGRKTSKTICEEKADRIRRILKGDTPSSCSPSFVFWVKKRKRFQLLSYEELKIKDVLCLPAKVKVMSLVRLNIMY